MPIQNFDGNTFIAFTDISGFKQLMLNRNNAISTLQHFYQCGFDIIQNQPNNSLKVEGFFISDCAILFIRNSPSNNLQALHKLLKAIEKFNKKMLEKDLMLTTSISYGYFNYEGKFEISGTEKNQIFGDAYVEAFLDNETGKPKIRPGECRILLKRFPNDLILFQNNRNDEYRLIKIKNYLYYYWMVNSLDEVDAFNTRYNDSYNLQFRGMVEALKNRQ